MSAIRKYSIAVYLFKRVVRPKSKKTFDVGICLHILQSVHLNTAINLKCRSQNILGVDAQMAKGQSGIDGDIESSSGVRHR